MKKEVPITGKKPDKKEAPKSRFARIIRPDAKERKALEIAFLQSFGKSYTKLRKEDLALMVFTQSANYQSLGKNVEQVAQIGIRMKTQRDWFHKLCRFKNHKCSLDGGEYVKL